METDVSKITSVETLKAMVYDNLAGIENAQRNNQLLNQRIAELSQPKEVDTKSK